MTTESHSLARSDDRVIAGVIGGLAHHFGLEPTLLRLATVFFVVTTGLIPGIAAYAAGIFLMPSSHTRGSRSTVEATVSTSPERPDAG